MKGHNSSKERQQFYKVFLPNRKVEKVSKFALVLAGASTLFALLLGIVAFQYSFKIIEESFQRNFLKEASLLAAFVESFPRAESDEEVLSQVEKFWQNAGEKPEDEYVCIVDKKTNLILHTSAPNTVGNYAGTNKILNSGVAGVTCLVDLHSHPMDYVGEYIASSGEYQIAAFKNIPGRNWILGVHRSREKTYSELTAKISILAIGYLIVCCLLFPLSFLLLYKTLRKSQKFEREIHKALFESEIRFSSFVQNIPVGVAILDTSQNVEYINEKFIAMFGYTLSDLKTIDDWWLAAFPNAESRSVMKKEWSNAVEEAEKMNKEVRAVQAKVKCKDSTFKYVEVIGDWIGDKLAVIFNDITEKKNTEELLRKNDKQISTLMANLPGMAYRCLNDHEWTMIFLSEGCKDLTGYAPSELINNNKTSYAEIIHKEDRKMVRKIVQKEISLNKSFQIEYRIIRADGNERWVWEKGRGVFDENNNLEALEGFIMDITDRKNIERELVEQQDKLEEIVKERTTELQEKNIELENYNKLFTGREFRIKELKSKIKELESKLN